jgi:hypothetical protein
MSFAADSEDWTLLNQKLLSAELARLRQRLAGEGDGSDMATLDSSVEEARDAMRVPSALDSVAALFGLTPFEREALLLCCGVELDSRIGTACAGINANPTLRNATFSMALAVLAEPHWSAITPEQPLRRWKLIEIEHGRRLVDSPLRVDERILHFVAGINHLDARLRALLTPITAQARVMTAAHDTLASSIAEFMRAARSAATLVLLDGDDPHSQVDVAAMAVERLGLSLWRMAAEDLPVATADLEHFRLLCEREAMLAPLVLLVDATSSESRSLGRFLEWASAPCIVMAREPVDAQRAHARFTVQKPHVRDQKQLWIDALGEGAAALNGGIDALAAQFRLSARSIDSIAAPFREAGGGPGTERALRAAARARGRERLDTLAQRIETSASWDDLVLPLAQKGTLRQLSAQVRHRIRVLEEWGFARHGSRGLGTSALFCGESGTGKTLAAEVLARELDLDLYRIDLASIVSKYIGETEKNLRRVFDAAEDTGAILLFDEADALFGKRSEVKDSHDRYANIEISYLLQRMESYGGLAILTTNMKSALDRAFQRRLRFILNFPFPDSGLREEIWRRAFPDATPREGIDFTKLARLNLPGGNIRNIAVSAAFLAAEADQPMSMLHLLHAAQNESAKMERPLAESEIRGWA